MHDSVIHILKLHTVSGEEAWKETQFSVGKPGDMG